jgi:hypothetical protein
VHRPVVVGDEDASGRADRYDDDECENEEEDEHGRKAMPVAEESRVAELLKGVGFLP